MEQSCPQPGVPLASSARPCFCCVGFFLIALQGLAPPGTGTTEAMQTPKAGTFFPDPGVTPKRGARACGKRCCGERSALSVLPQPCSRTLTIAGGNGAAVMPSSEQAGYLHASAGGAEPVPRTAQSLAVLLTPQNGSAHGDGRCARGVSKQVWGIRKSSKRLLKMGTDADIWQSRSGYVRRVRVRRHGGFWPGLCLRRCRSASCRVTGGAACCSPQSPDKPQPEERKTLSNVGVVKDILQWKN